MEILKALTLGWLFKRSAPEALPIPACPRCEGVRRRDEIGKTIYLTCLDCRNSTREDDIVFNRSHSHVRGVTDRNGKCIKCGALGFVTHYPDAGRLCDLCAEGR